MPSLRIPLLLLLPPLALALDLTSHCASQTPPGECRCSQRQPAAPTFCLSATSATSCRQRPCRPRYVCDCAGPTLCRLLRARPALACTAPLDGRAACLCARAPLRAPPGARPPSTLLPLRPFAPVRTVAPRRPARRFCSERPAFWARREGARLLRAHWRSVVAAAAPRGELARTSARARLRFGHAGNAVSFSSAASLSAALSRVVDGAQADSGEVVDAASGGVSRLVSECAAAVVNVRLAARGVGTRREMRPHAFDVENDMVLRPCAHLPRTNGAVGMSLGRVLENAMLATGEFPVDEAALGREEATQACAAINRNFEACGVDLGCIVVTA